MNNIKELYGEAIIDSRDSEELNIGERIKLEYYKTISKLFANGNRETYGIGIVKKYKDTKKEKIESREINNILLEEKQTEKLLKILINNKVTPIALDDVLTDLIRAYNYTVKAFFWIYYFKEGFLWGKRIIYLVH